MNTLKTPIVVKAAEFARKAHESQKRKYTGEPYFNHCEEVATIVALAGGTVEQICAAYLHDTMEDCGVSVDTIEEEFGGYVARLVSDLTDVSKPEDGNRATRKAIDRAHTAKACPDAKTVKLADLISNTQSVMKHDLKFASVYIPEKVALLEYLKEGDPNLYKIASSIAHSAMKTLNL